MNLFTDMRIADFIKKEHISFFEETDRAKVLEILIHKVVATGTLNDSHKFYEAIVQRENVVSTGIGMGIAIPHAKCEECDDFFISIGIHTKEGIDWDAIDGLNVKLVFLIGGPVMHKEYLLLLSKLTTAIREESARQNIIRAKRREEVVKIFENC